MPDLYFLSQSADNAWRINKRLADHITDNLIRDEQSSDKMAAHNFNRSGSVYVGGISIKSQNKKMPDTLMSVSELDACLIFSDKGKKVKCDLKITRQLEVEKSNRNWPWSKLNLKKKKKDARRNSFHSGSGG